MVVQRNIWMRKWKDTEFYLKRLAVLLIQYF